tara:strand:+ start:5381 stop:6226 length:846 start_codon:yes stop_codon:yes gene_type:complete
MSLYRCKACNYETDRLNNWNKHLNTAKHKKNSKFNKYIDDEGKYTCNICNKKYKYKSGLSKHSAVHINDNKIITSTIQENKDIETLCSLLEQSLTQNKENLDKILPKVGNVTNNINKMTVNVFLNDHCQGAMNISDFVEKIQVSVQDLNYTGDNGYAKGISNIFAKNLSQIPATERPIHCCDKQEPVEFYVKEENKWEKDIQNEKINKTINSVSLKQVAAIKTWEEQYPNWSNDEQLTSEYINLIQKITNGHDNKNAINEISTSIGEQTDITNQPGLLIEN